MFGWSNPNKLDAPFQVGDIRKHFKQVTETLKKRRLTLMRGDAESGQNRLGKVDSYYEFPKTFGALSGRLEKYLSTIFSPGRWESKKAKAPPFLRGVYFTSSIQQGAILDEVVLNATGNQFQHCLLYTSDAADE